MANAVRVKTGTGWQDIALQGPAGLTQVWISNDPPTPRGDYVLWVDLDEPDQPIEAPHYVGTAGEPAFTNSWQNFDATRAAYFYKDRGRVYMGGLIKAGATGTAAFTLPAGYRPVNSNSYLPVLANNATAYLRIDGGGVVFPFNLGTAGAVEAWCSLEVNFRQFG